MKKVLLISIICFFISSIVVAYETILIDFPKKSKWEVIYYKKIPTEAILQYIPEGQDRVDWKQSIFVHSYKESTYPAHRLSDKVSAQMVAQNPTGKYRYLRYSGIDCIAVRSTSDYKGVKGQSEIFRTTKAAEGMMTIQYIDRDKTHFQQNFNTWLKIIKEARLYNSYWRDDRVLNKEESYEL